jgi:hypothetical protein
VIWCVVVLGFIFGMPALVWVISEALEKDLEMYGDR